MIRCAIIEQATNNVVNVIEYETVPQGTPPGFEAGHFAVASDTAGPGDIYNPADGTFTDTRPPLPQPPEMPPDQALIEAQRANARLDDGYTAAVDGATKAKERLASMPPHSVPPTIEELQAQIDYLAAEVIRLTDSYVSMVQAQKPT